MVEYEYPKEIQVGGHTIKVELVDAYTIDGHAKYSGESGLFTGNIKIALKLPTGENQTIATTNEILWHEIFHLISDVFAMKLEEVQVEQLGQGLLQVLNGLGLLLIKEKDAD